jgi:hypothetical protein
MGTAGQKAPPFLRAAQLRVKLTRDFFNSIRQLLFQCAGCFNAAAFTMTILHL